MGWIKIIFIYSLAMIAMNAFAQKERKYIRQGNKEFENANFENSEVSYRKAVDLEEEKTHEPAFNVGDALYMQEKYDGAIEQFNNLADVEVSKEEKSKIYHNLGNSLLQNNKLQESIEAYKNALRNNPDDMDTKYNLAYAQKKLEEQQQQNQNQDQNKDNQDQQDQDKNEDNQDQNQQDKQEQNKDQQQQQQPQISKEDAERILQALANDEKDTQKKVKEQQAAAAKVKVEKEW
jgi:tetratricopeptide (TPR) repeat protein